MFLVAAFQGKQLEWAGVLYNDFPVISVPSWPAGNPWHGSRKILNFPGRWM